MAKKEIVLNPDGSLNVLDPNKIYCLVATFPGNIISYRVKLYINKQNENKLHGFFRITSIKGRDIRTQGSIAFENKYLQYSIQLALESTYSHYSKILLSFDSLYEFLAWCKDNQKLFNIEVT